MNFRGFCGFFCILFAGGLAAAEEPTAISIKLDRDTLRDTEKRIASVDMADWGKYLTLDGDPDAVDEQENTLLHRCAEWDMVRLCRFVISQGGDVNAPNGEGMTPPMKYRGDDVEIWHAFLKAGMDLKQTDAQGNTVLHRAVSMPVTVCEKLLDAGAEVNVLNAGGMTPLGVTAWHSSATPQLAKLLLDAGADVNLCTGHSSPLIGALYRESSTLAHLLLEAGAEVVSTASSTYSPMSLAAKLWDVDLMRKMLEKLPDDDTMEKQKQLALYAAADCGNPAMCALLLDAGVDINARTATGQEPIFRAIQNNHEPTVRFLLEKGAKLEADDTQPLLSSHILQNSPLALAAQTGNLELCKLLVRHGARFMDDGPDRMKLMHHAVTSGSVEMCRYVANFNSDMNVRAQGGNTPLHLAAERLNYELCVFLLSRGAKVDAKNDAGRTPVVMAAMQQSPLQSRAGLRVILLLMEAGADILAEPQDKTSAMNFILLNSGTREAFLSKHMQLLTGRFRDAKKPDSLLMAAYEGDLERFKRLVEAGKDPAMKDDDTESAIHFAIRGGKAEMVKHLLDTGTKTDAPGHFDGTPLHYAAALGQREILEMLLDAGAEIDAKDKYYQATPLLWAIDASQGTCVVALVRRGADVGLQAGQRYNAFIQALRDRKYTYCDFFIQNGYDLNETAKTGPLFDNVPQDRRTLEGLKKYGLDFTLQNNDGATIMHSVFRRNDQKADIRFLLENGAGVCMTVKDSSDKTPADYTKANRREGLINKVNAIMKELEE